MYMLIVDASFSALDSIHLCSCLFLDQISWGFTQSVSEKNAYLSLTGWLVGYFIRILFHNMRHVWCKKLPPQIRKSIFFLSTKKRGTRVKVKSVCINSVCHLKKDSLFSSSSYLTTYFPNYLEIDWITIFEQPISAGSVEILKGLVLFKVPVLMWRAVEGVRNKGMSWKRLQLKFIIPCKLVRHSIWF